MLELKSFQSESAKLISGRYGYFAQHPDRPRKGQKPRPFFQALSALTGAGKTPLLAEAVAGIRAQLGSEPIVFWISRAKSVVAQTTTNFSAGGKYNHIMDGFRVTGIGGLNPQMIKDFNTPLLVLATTGLFNNKDQSEGALNIYKADNDLFGDKSPWDRLIERGDGKSRRPLFVVYDEGHNLSEQQTELLSELEPEGYLLASATLRLPQNFAKSVVQPIRLWVEELDDTEELTNLKAVVDGKPDAEQFITTTVDSKKVVKAELVKLAIQFDGTTATMERSLDDLIDRMQLLDGECKALALKLRPKAIYVCKTNIADDGEKDDPTLPFSKRQAPPIKIWRYLVEHKKIPPSEIAIYANLAISEKVKPDEVNLFSKGENDFDEFKEGNFRHIIFNLSLQEGWDDPECYLAYVDKSMGSALQVEQVMGRVLRQYDAKHYDSPALNTAHFFVRVDSQSVFSETIAKVRDKLRAEGAPIEISESFGKSTAAPAYLAPKDGLAPPLHHIFVDSESARSAINKLVDDFIDIDESSPNAKGLAHTATQIIDLVDNGATVPATWSANGHTNPVRLRWLINTAVKARSSRTLAVLDLKGPKFDARVQLNSKANKLVDALARDCVAAFYQHSELVYESADPFHFGPIRVGKNPSTYEHSLYERYGGMNKFELAFAGALDTSGELWHRNPSVGGFHIPLLSEGDTASFFPDFIAWRKGVVYCVDTKGGHLLSEAASRKLFDIREDGKVRLHVRFVSEGQQTAIGGKVIKGGYTVWKAKLGQPTAVSVDSLDAAVAESLKP